MGWTEVFQDVLESVGETAKYGPEYFGHAHFEGGARHGWFMEKCLKNRGEHELITSSDRIKTSYMFDIRNTGRFHNPGVPRKRSNPQLLTTGSVEFASQDNELLFLDQEVIFNGGGGLKGRRTQYTHLANVKLTNLRASEILTMEESAFAVPDPDTMETVTHPAVRKPYSMFAFCNESNGFVVDAAPLTRQASQTTALAAHTGLFNITDGAGLMQQDWTTVAGISGTAQPLWKNGVGEYTHASTTSAGVDGNGDNLYDSGSLISQMDNAYEQVQFETPTSSKNYYEHDDFRRQHVITEIAGKNLYRRLLRASNDTLAMGHQDAGYNRPTIYGVEMDRVQAFEDAQVYANGDLTGLTTSSAGTPLGGTSADSAAYGPRFMFHNSQKLHPIFHSERFMQQITSYRVQGAEETNVNVYQSWWNWCPASRQRLFMLRGNLAATL